MQHYIRIIVIVGGRRVDGQYYDNIYLYKEDDDEWINAGNMKTKRAYHAVSVVSKQKILLILIPYQVLNVFFYFYYIFGIDKCVS